MNERYGNRLVKEKSPYLLQHAHNPVDWRPWGKSTFEEAKRKDVPLFISIGYSTCHWCHVMANESFENEKVAELLNEGFVPVKVDKEERPDVDSAYMKGCQMATGGGGWPLTVIATPEGKPFFFGTYIPRESVHGRRGLLDLLPAVTEMWRNNRKDLLRSSEAISAEMSKKNPGGDKYDPGWIEIAYGNMKKEFDPENGGFGTSPKFPMPHRIIFLLRYWFSTNDEKPLNMARDTLEAMRLGGIYDQVGGGFHRYSTDRMWGLPHFEKMLYDQATHLMAYTEGWQATRDNLFSRTAEEIVDYVLDVLGDPSGCFHSSEDADTDGVEGKYYTWSEEELAEVLGRESGRDFMISFGISSGGNFAEEATGKKTGRNVLHPISRNSMEEYQGELKKLKKVRDGRRRPFKDDKVLTDWNGLFLTALARAGRVFQREDWLDRAEKGLDFILNEMRSDDGALFHRYRSGDASVAGFLDDYSFVILALLETYRGRGRKRYLAESIGLAERMEGLFWDDEEGGFYNRSPDDDKLQFLDKEAYDGAKPSGNSAASMALLRLSRLTGDQRYEKISDRIIRHFSGEVDRSPQSYSYLLSSMLHATGKSREIILVGDQNDDNTLKMRNVIDSIYDPFQVVVSKYSGPERIDDIVPYASEAKAINGNPTAYVCREFNCDVPVQNPRELERSLK